MLPCSLAPLPSLHLQGSNTKHRQLRAELAAELGWYPADLDDESVARHRAAARKSTEPDPAKKWAHLAELKRQRDVEAAGRAAVADLYDTSAPDSGAVGTRHDNDTGGSGTTIGG
jgi:hypothetical protein